MGIAITNPLATSQSQTTPTGTSSATAASSASAPSNLANQNTFLQLLVAQLQNQDPLNPEDGTQFVSQLAQLSELQQVISINQGVSNIATAITTTPTPTTSASTQSSAGSTQDSAADSSSKTTPT
jgi:flagellar basal-body rod modification protein FlgD